MPQCGSQIVICDLPIRYDSYVGCSHGCTYCFARAKGDIDIVSKGESATNLEKFIRGGRTKQTNWCDWNIPIHFGGMSDGFQPLEREKRWTLEALKVLAETKYPVVISTKGKLCIESPWLDLLKECNVVMQISAACSEYDILEPGAPTYKERLKMIEVLSENVQRVIVRCQPYIREFRKQIEAELPNMAAAGAYGVIFEAMKYKKKKRGLVRVGGDFTYPVEYLKYDFGKLRDKCHAEGLKFYAGENRLREMGDSLTCCGIDGLEGFRPNTFNASHHLNGDFTVPTKAMKEPNAGIDCFKGIHQTGEYGRRIAGYTFEEVMRSEMKQDYAIKAMGKGRGVK